MDFDDFPKVSGKSGKYQIHPPELCAGLICMPRGPRSPCGEVVGAALEVLAFLRYLERSGPPELQRGKVERVEESVPLRLHLPLAIGWPSGKEHENSAR